MVLANDRTVSADNYRGIIKSCGLEDAFQEAWGADVSEDRTEVGLGSVSEDKIIEETLEEDDEHWTFVMNVENKRFVSEVTYYIVKVNKESITPS